MKLVTFSHGDHIALGAMENGSVVDFGAADTALPADMNALIEAGDAGLDRARAAAAAAGPAARHDLGGVRLLAPVPRPRRNVFCVGKNYHAHANEFFGSGFDTSDSAAVPEVPIYFTKATTSVIGPGDPIHSDADPEDSVDYEVELTVVIGRGGRDISRAEALSHVFGYTIVNDVTSRGLQRRHKQWFLGKSIDSYCPMGPCIVTSDEIPDLHALEVRAEVNGELRQKASVRDLIFDVPTLISTLSSVVTLEPGDLIATGTPEGVGIGFKPPRFLRSGDEVVLTIEPIGELRNPVV